MRGAFGWYAARLTPNAYSQHTHGTVGWSKDKKDFIFRTKTILANAFFDPRSHGCSRTDNESIAYVRQLLSVGTPVLKIYAREKIQSSWTTYEEYKQWDYVISKDLPRSTAHRKAALEENLDLSEDKVLDRGTYTVDLTPTAVPFSNDFGGKETGSNGNVYGLEKEDMQGVFYVDTGVLEDYKHPVHEKIVVGGFESQKGKDRLGLPDFVLYDETKILQGVTLSMPVETYTDCDLECMNDRRIWNNLILRLKKPFDKLDQLSEEYEE